MATMSLGESIEVKAELIKKTCSMAMKPHKTPFLVDKSRSDVVFSFPGSWSPNDWFSHGPFGEIKIDRKLFPSLRSIGNDDEAIGRDEVAKVNKAFMDKFLAISKSLKSEVEKAVSERKQIVFTGHSSGGPIAILATVWFLENYLKPDPKKQEPLCVTYGSPLVGDRVFNHALRRENWSRFFIHFVVRYDIVPRILLASPVEKQLQEIFYLLKQRTTVRYQSNETASAFYVNVMRNESSVASHAACHLKGNTNQLLETLSSFIELSPYRPFGTYVFCTENDKLVVIRNPDAVLQVLFYSSQLNSEAEVQEVARKSLTQHMDYQTKLPRCLETQNVAYLDRLEDLPLSTDNIQSVPTSMILNELGLGVRARLCLRAAGEVEKQKFSNQKKIDSKKLEIEKGIQELERYKTMCMVHKVGYYDAFKISKDTKDFEANVCRLQLAGIWDEIIEMVKRYELPDGFEGRKEWIELGTRYRHLVEPLDIANYYRHSKNEDTGPYMATGRPKRYKFTQRCLEHELRMPTGSRSESCFWAKVEELIRTLKQKTFEDVKDDILNLESEVEKWIRSKELDRYVLLEESTFIKWWKKLPDQHKSGSCIS
ncbi:Lipase_3 domain-containing protein [Cephalotus follicularis]|uniref:Lipase_3 domain-containing protein n=1 Tax=Cephalotus follicularis TaxID=3775 RepID=A0A1Q3C2E8_CEPFO|nr:Lipase_3 domain-containing protein [Cephalotus follicularis]